MSAHLFAALVSLAFLLCPAVVGKELPTAAELDTDSHLAGWWRFDDAAGRRVADSSPHNRSGQLAGSLSVGERSVPGRIGGALRFAGDGDVVLITGYKGVAGTAPRTLSVWVKTDAPTGEIVSWGKKDFGRMWRLCFIRKHMGVTPEGGYFYMAAVIDDGEWHHIAAAVRDAQPPNLHDDVTLYLDGVVAEIDNIGLLDLWPIETGSDQDVTIGTDFRGAIDELRIYDRALSDEEIAALYALGNPVRSVRQARNGEE